MELFYKLIIRKSFKHGKDYLVIFIQRILQENKSLNEINIVLGIL